MADLHKLRISSPDGAAWGTEVTLDGQQIRPVALTLTADAQGSGTIRAVIEFDMISVEFDGMAEVVGKIIPHEDAPAGA